MATISYQKRNTVLPLTREWIEIAPICPTENRPKRSPSYEGVDWNLVLNSEVKIKPAFSLLRGSGLKSPPTALELPLPPVLPLTREWIEIPQPIVSIRFDMVLPLTREWIEMGFNVSSYILRRGSPSYEGVDWNRSLMPFLPFQGGSPSYEGVDWNTSRQARQKLKREFSLLRGSGLKFFKEFTCIFYFRSPSYEGVDWNDFLCQISR